MSVDRAADPRLRSGRPEVRQEVGDDLLGVVEVGEEGVEFGQEWVERVEDGGGGAEEAGALGEVSGGGFDDWFEVGEEVA